ncbi:translation initiation factor IF-3 [Candidatus Parcubacteria bacterium]|nr:translation initiation factor IF-3 [Candidatus Parcubacteria bacterium]
MYENYTPCAIIHLIKKNELQTPRTNHAIRVRELRVIGPKGENFGVLTLEEALKKAEEFSLDLIEISPNANPPVAKITDLGKYMYEENKKQKASKGKAHSVEVKTVQVKLGTGDHDLGLKAKKASTWLGEGNRVKIDLFLPGRAKYLDEKFLRERIDRILKLLTVPYTIADPAKKSPKGMTVIIERAR